MASRRSRVFQQVVLEYQIPDILESLSIAPRFRAGFLFWVLDYLRSAYYDGQTESPQGLFIYPALNLTTNLVLGLPETYLAMTALFTYLKHVREEFAHIVWPSNRTAIAHTLVVIFIAIVIAIWVGALDGVFSSVVSSVAG